MTVTYVGKIKDTAKGIDGLKSLVTPFGAEAQQGSTEQSFFVSAPEALSFDQRVGLEHEGFVITGNV